MAVAWLGIIVLLGLLVGGVAFIALLMRYPGTRWMGVALLVTAAILVPLVVLVSYVRLASYEPRIVTAERYAPSIVVLQDRPKKELPLRAVSAAKPQAAVSPEKEKPPRPAWIDDKPHDEPDGYQLVVAVGPYSTEVECQREMPAKLRQALDDYLELHWPAGLRPRVDASLDMLLSKQFNIVREMYRETVQSSFGPMQMLHARLVFGDEVKQWCQELARERLLYRRLAVAGGLLGLVFGAMTVAWGYLRLGPTAGRGSRLLAAVAGAMALAAVAFACLWTMSRFQ